MHGKDAGDGETGQRLDGLIADDQVPGTVYNEANTDFSDEEMVKLVLSIMAITVGDQARTSQPDHFVTEPHERVAVASD